MQIYPDDRVLIAIMNNPADWQLVQDEGWYRIPAKKAPAVVPNIDVLAFYFTARFGPDKWAVHYYAPVKGHELVTRAQLRPDQPNHPRAGDWYYQLMLGPLQHKLPPIISNKWRRITFIATSGDRFENAVEINDLFERESPLGQLYVTLKEDGLLVEQYWIIQEEKASYTVDLAINTGDDWLAVNLKPEQVGPEGTIHLSSEDTLNAQVNVIKQALKDMKRDA